MKKFLFYVVIFLTLKESLHQSELSLKCADQNCTGIIGTGKKYMNRHHLTVNIHGILNKEQYLISDEAGKVRKIIGSYLLEEKYINYFKNKKLITIKAVDDIHKIISLFDKHYSTHFNEPKRQENASVHNMRTILPNSSKVDIFFINETNVSVVHKFRLILPHCSKIDVFFINKGKAEIESICNNSNDLINDRNSTLNESDKINRTIGDYLLEKMYINSTEDQKPITINENDTVYQPIINQVDENDFVVQKAYPDLLHCSKIDIFFINNDANKLIVMNKNDTEAETVEVFVSNETIENNTTTVDEFILMYVQNQTKSDIIDETINTENDTLSNLNMNENISNILNISDNSQNPGYCEKSNETETLYDSIYYLIRNNVNESTVNRVVVLAITAIAIVIFLIISNWMFEKSTDTKFAKKLNEIEQKYLQMCQEKNRLEEELIEKCDTHIPKDEFQEISEQLKKLKHENRSLKKETEQITEISVNAIKNLTSKKDEKNLEATNLKKKLEHVENNFKKLQNNFDAISRANYELENTIRKFSEMIKSLENENTNLTKDFDKFKNDSQQRLNDKDNEIILLKEQLNSLQLVYDKSQKDSKLISTELQLMKKKLSDENESFFDTDLALNNNQLEAKIQVLVEENEDLEKKVKQFENENRLFSTEIKKLQEELTNLNQAFTNTTNEKNDLQIRLDVLSIYFKDKETELLKKIEYQKAMITEKDDTSKDSLGFMENLKKENTMLSNQINALRKEINEMKKSHQSHIVTLKEEYNQLYVEARTAERNLEDSRLETRQLRNMLSQFEKYKRSDITLTNDLMGIPPVGINGNIQIPLQSGGSETNSFSFGIVDSEITSQTSPETSSPPPPPPPFFPPAMYSNGMMPPPPPLMPPMPFPQQMFMNDQRRPPPLGRLSSPPPPPFPTFLGHNNQHITRRRHSYYNSGDSRSGSSRSTSDEI